jgi:hypothetical protein
LQDHVAASLPAPQSPGRRISDAHDRRSPGALRHRAASVGQKIALRQGGASYPRRCLLVIHDRGAQQKGASGEATVHKAGGRLALKPQPAYSPKLNPQERIWKWLRRVVTYHR